MNKLDEKGWGPLAPNTAGLKDLWAAWAPDEDAVACLSTRDLAPHEILSGMAGLGMTNAINALTDN
jgi:hypothetical protein